MYEVIRGKGVALFYVLSFQVSSGQGEDEHVLVPFLVRCLCPRWRVPFAVPHAAAEEQQQPLRSSERMPLLLRLLYVHV